MTDQPGNPRPPEDDERRDTDGGEEPAAYGVIERLAERLRDLGLWLMRLVS